MTTLASVLVLALWTALTPAAPVAPGTTPAVAQDAPPIAGKLLDGTSFDLSAMRGKVVLVDFWATWCEPCKLSLPRYVALQKKLADKGFVILTVSVDEEADVLERFVKTMKLSLKVLQDSEQKIVERYAPPKMPTAFLVGKDGKIAWIHQSFVPGDEAKVEAAALAALAR